MSLAAECRHEPVETRVCEGADAGGDRPAEPSDAVVEQFSDRVTSLADLAESIKGRDWSRNGMVGEVRVSAIDLLREGVAVGVDALSQVERIITSLD